MRAFLGDVARFLSERAINHARRADPVWRIRWLRRSLFWRDVDVWLSGLRPWKTLKASRERRLDALYAREARNRRISNVARKLHAEQGDVPGPGIRA